MQTKYGQKAVCYLVLLLPSLGNALFNFCVKVSLAHVIFVIANECHLDVLKYLNPSRISLFFCTVGKGEGQCS